MVKAERYLDNKYDTRRKREKTELNINRKDLSGELNLYEFKNLEHLDCSHNRLSELDISDCKRLKELRCSHNEITELDLPLYHGLIRLEKIMVNDNLLDNFDYSVLDP